MSWLQLALLAVIASFTWRAGSQAKRAADEIYLLRAGEQADPPDEED